MDTGFLLGGVKRFLKLDVMVAKLSVAILKTAELYTYNSKSFMLCEINLNKALKIIYINFEHMLQLFLFHKCQQLKLRDLVL